MRPPSPKTPKTHKLLGFVNLSAHDCACAGGGNFNCPIPGPKSAAPEDDALAELEDDLSRTIVDCEVNSSAWTLMHRYNKATELLDSVLNVSLLCTGLRSASTYHDNSKNIACSHCDCCSRAKL